MKNRSIKIFALGILLASALFSCKDLTVEADSTIVRPKAHKNTVLQIIRK